MYRRQGFTLLEIIVVLIIIAIAIAFSLPNFTVPSEQALALTAKNNLLAIYSAERNYYNNNNGNFCWDAAGNATCGDSLPDLNTNLALNIQDDGTYSYSCSSAANTCTAARNAPFLNDVVITVTLTSPIQLNGGINPAYSGPNTNWYPV